MKPQKEVPQNEDDALFLAAYRDLNRPQFQVTKEGEPQKPLTFNMIEVLREAA